MSSLGADVEVLGTGPVTRNPLETGLKPSNHADHRVELIDQEFVVSIGVEEDFAEDPPPLMWQISSWISGGG